MPRNADPKAVDPDEYKRFLETAKQVEASEDPEAFDRAFGKVVKPIKPARPAKP
jgi:hypothetical protein